MMVSINISEDFTKTPGARYIREGNFSGEEFRQKILLPKYKECVSNNEKLEINFDGCYGYATSFLEEAFGGLVRELQVFNILNNIEIVSYDDLSIMELIEEYVKEAENEISKK
jgi:hypothetical protein